MMQINTPGEALDLLAFVEERLRKGLLAASLFGDVVEAPRIGRFALRRKIGAGAMGVVFEAHDAQLDRLLAIKLVRNEAKTEVHTERLLREARAMARLSHPEVVTVYEAGRWEGGLFIAMELLRGGTLQEWLAEKNRDTQEILAVFLSAGRGLAAAHKAGLIHRDFKPANVLIGDDARPRVGDFGLVRLLEDRTPTHGQGAATQDASCTTTGGLVGTPAYMAPEQLMGLQLDGRADQFSFCVALYEALCGVSPFVGESREERLQHIQQGYLSPPRKANGRNPSRGVLRVLQRGLSAKPEARFPSLDALLDALINAERPATGRRVLVLCGTLLGLLGLAGNVFGQAHEQNPQPAPVSPPAENQNHDLTILTAARNLAPQDPTLAAVLLREVEAPAKYQEWSRLAAEVLDQPLARFVWNGAHVSLSRHSNKVVVLHDLEGNLVARSLDDGRELLRKSAGIWAAVNPQSDEILVQTNEGLSAFPIGQTTPEPVWFSVSPNLARVAVGQDGREILAIKNDGSVLRWDKTRPAVPTLLRRIGDGSDNTRALLFPDAGLAWMSAPNEGIEVWPLQSSGPALRPDLGGKDFSASQMAKNGAMAVGFEDGSIRYWSKTARVPLVLREHASAIRHVRLSAGGERLVAWGEDGTTRVWDLRTGAASNGLPPQESVKGIALDDKGQRLVLDSGGKTITQVYDLVTGEVAMLRGRGDSGDNGRLSPDGTWVFTGTADNTARAWPLHTSVPTHVFGHTAPIWAGEVRGDRLVTAAQDGTARVWGWKEGGGLREMAVLSSAPASRVWTAVFSPDGEHVATGSNDGKARIWKADGSGAPVVLGGHEEWAYALAFERDGRSLLTGSKQGCIRRFPLQGGAPEVVFCQANVRGQVNQIVLRPDGRAGAAALASGQLVLWGDLSGDDGAGGRNDARVISSAHADVVQSIAFSPDGRRLVSVGRDHKVRVWDPLRGVLVRELKGHKDAVYHARFSPDGRFLATSSADGTTRVWSMAGESEPLILRGHEGWVVWAEFDPSGKRLVSSGYDGTARVWDLAAPASPRVLRGHVGPVRYATFVEEGRGVITTSMDGTVRRWDVVEQSVERLQQRLREATRACLTAQQRMELLREDKAEAAERAAGCGF